MELRQLRYFMAIAKHGGFKKASIELHVAQPALSRQIGLLEHEVGAPLFVRHANGSILTDEGRALLAEAEQILDRTDTIKRKIQLRNQEISGQVTVGLMPTMAEWLAPDLFERVRCDLPQVRLRFIEGLTPRLRGLLVAGEIDVAVLALDVDPTDLLLGAATCEPVALIGQARAPMLNASGPIDLADIVTLPLILAGVEKEGVRKAVDGALRQSKLGFANVVAEAETMFVARRMAERGIGYSLSPVSAVERDIERGELSARPVRHLFLERIVARAAKHPSSAATLAVTKAIVALLKSRFPPRPRRTAQS